MKGRHSHEGKGGEASVAPEEASVKVEQPEAGKEAADP